MVSCHGVALRAKRNSHFSDGSVSVLGSFATARCINCKYEVPGDALEKDIFAQVCNTASSETFISGFYEFK